MIHKDSFLCIIWRQFIIQKHSKYPDAIHHPVACKIPIFRYYFVFNTIEYGRLWLLHWNNLPIVALHCAPTVQRRCGVTRWVVAFQNLLQLLHFNRTIILAFNPQAHQHTNTHPARGSDGNVSNFHFIATKCHFTVAHFHMSIAGNLSITRNCQVHSYGWIINLQYSLT